MRLSRRNDPPQRNITYRPRRAAVQVPAAPTNKVLMEYRPAPARRLERYHHQEKTRMERRGESRGGDSPPTEFWHPLWPSLLLSRERERRTSTKGYFQKNRQQTPRQIPVYHLHSPMAVQKNSKPYNLLRLAAVDCFLHHIGEGCFSYAVIPGWLQPHPPQRPPP